MVTALLIALAAFAFWGVSVYVYPFRHCAGTGRVQRIGSRAAHRAVLSVRSEITRERQRCRDRKADERTTRPRRLDRP